jgi:hypothetical protein
VQNGEESIEIIGRKIFVINDDRSIDADARSDDVDGRTHWRQGVFPLRGAIVRNDDRFVASHSDALGGLLEAMQSKGRRWPAICRACYTLLVPPWRPTAPSAPPPFRALRFIACERRILAILVRLGASLRNGFELGPQCVRRARNATKLKNSRRSRKTRPHSGSSL